MLTIIYKFLNKRQLFISCLLGLSLLMTSTALAAYKPSNQKPAPDDARSEAGTTRGCDGSELSPTILASRSYIGQTTSAYPTFAWFIPDTKPLSMKFRLYEINAEGKATQLVYQTTLETSPGIMTYSPINRDQPGLETGKTYLWQVIVYCDASPSSALVDSAYLEVVDISSEQKQQLEQITNSKEKAYFYAQAGIWYDALGEALKLAPIGKLGDIGTGLVQDLINIEKSALNSEISDYERQNLENLLENLEQISAQFTSVTPTATANATELNP